MTSNSVHPNSVINVAVQLQILQGSNVSQIRQLDHDWSSMSDEQQASTLVEMGMLTEFQSQELIEGRGADLVVGEYRVTEALPAPEDCKLFAAVDSKTMRKARIYYVPLSNAAAKSKINDLLPALDYFIANPHPCLVNVLSYSIEQNVLRCVTDYPVGKTLETIIQANGALPIVRAVRCGLMVADALATLHSQNVIHGSLQPSDLIVTANNQVQVDRIFDMMLWGNNQDKPQTLSLSNVQATSPVDFVSPEQAWGKTPTYQTDIYRLGLTLYTLLTGKRAFTGTVMQRLTDRQNRAVQLTAEAVANLPNGLAAVIHKMTSPDPIKRQQSCLEVIQELAPFDPESAKNSRINGVDLKRQSADAKSPKIAERNAKAKADRLEAVNETLNQPGRSSLPMWVIIGVTVFAIALVGVILAR